jgi:hypothetical protein
MKIYFAGSIRGGRDDASLYASLISVLGTHGTVLTEHFGASGISTVTGTGKDVAAIYAQDMAWVREADVIVAEVTQPSLGVGYEIAKAEDMGKRILCLYRPAADRSLSAMIAGSAHKNLVIKEYQNLPEAEQILAEYFKQEKTSPRVILQVKLRSLAQ